MCPPEALWVIRNRKFFSDFFLLKPGVDVGEGGGGDGAVAGVDHPPAGVLAPLVVGVQLVPDPAGEGDSKPKPNMLNLTCPLKMNKQFSVSL